MSGPANINPRAYVRDLDAMMRDSLGWPGLEAMAPGVHTDPKRPPDEFMKRLAASSQTEFGRELLNWLFDLTNRAPCPHVGNDFQAAALNAARYEARCAVGEVILAAVVEGRRLFDQQ